MNIDMYDVGPQLTDKNILDLNTMVDILFPPCLKYNGKARTGQEGTTLGKSHIFSPLMKMIKLLIFSKIIKLLATESQLTPWRLPIPQEAIWF